MMTILKIVVELCDDSGRMLLRGVYHPRIDVVVRRGQARRGRTVETSAPFLDPGSGLRTRKLCAAMRHIVSEWLIVIWGKAMNYCLLGATVDAFSASRGFMLRF
jgi:hypothetical protein